MDVRKPMFALIDQLVMITISAQDTAQPYATQLRNMFAQLLLKTDALNHQLAKQKKLTMKVNTVMSNTVN